MARVVAEKMKHCSNCDCRTLHRKNKKQMSWLMHFFFNDFYFNNLALDLDFNVNLACFCKANNSSYKSLDLLKVWKLKQYRWLINNLSNRFL